MVVFTVMSGSAFSVVAKLDRGKGHHPNPNSSLASSVRGPSSDRQAIPKWWSSRKLVDKEVDVSAEKTDSLRPTHVSCIATENASVSLCGTCTHSVTQEEENMNFFSANAEQASSLHAGETRVV